MVLNDTLQTALNVGHGHQPAAPVFSRFEVSVAKGVAEVRRLFQGVRPRVFRVKQQLSKVGLVKLEQGAAIPWKATSDINGSSAHSTQHSTRGSADGV